MRKETDRWLGIIQKKTTRMMNPKKGNYGKQPISTAEKVFYVPPSSRWGWLQGRAKLPTIGKDVDEAMDAIEKDNPSLRGVLPKVFAQEKLDKQSLGGLIDLVGSAELGTKEARGKILFIDTRNMGHLINRKNRELSDEEDDFDFKERFSMLKTEFEEQLKEEEKLNALIIENLVRVVINNGKN